MRHRSHEQGVCIPGLPTGGSASGGVGQIAAPHRYMDYYGIRLTSGRYASYWNVFLSMVVFGSSVVIYMFLTPINKWVHQQQNEINKIHLYNYSIIVSVILMFNTFFTKEPFVFVYFSPSGR